MLLASQSTLLLRMRRMGALALSSPRRRRSKLRVQALPPRTRRTDWRLPSLRSDSGSSGARPPTLPGQPVSRERRLRQRLLRRRMLQQLVLAKRVTTKMTTTTRITLSDDNEGEEASDDSEEGDDWSDAGDGGEVVLGEE